MKSLIIVILFILCTQVLSQINNRDKGNRLEIRVEKIDSDSLFFGGLKHLSEPDNFQNVDSKKIISKTTLDNGSELEEYIYQKWDGSNWVNTIKEIYKYNVNDNLVTLLSQKWEHNKWMNLKICIYSYHENNRVEGLLQKWDGSNWVNNIKEIYTYDVNDNLVEQIYQSWCISKWVDYSKKIYTNENNNLITYLYQRWSGSNWINIEKYLFTYDEKSSIIEHLWLYGVILVGIIIGDIYKYSHGRNNN